MKINNIEVEILKDYDAVTTRAAEMVITQIRNKVNSVLGLATGSTPIGLYQKLISAFKNEEIDFSKITTCNLDEYYPIDRGHDQSYWYFMHDQLFNHINLHEDNRHILNGQTKNIDEECKNYEKKINNLGGIDLQIIGIGNNGHIAFNEPGSSFDSHTRLINLNDSTIDANSRFFSSKNEVPKQALTMGLATIMEAKKIILLATGVNKAKAIKLALENVPSEKIPASILQKHPDCTFLIDKDAAKLLTDL